MSKDKKYRFWTEEEIEHLKRYYGVVPAWLIAESLGRSVNAVYCKAKRLRLRSGLRGNGKPPKFLTELILNDRDD